jgi:ABC-type phosphate/phosphonate transport system substrate-binding protein
MKHPWSALILGIGALLLGLTNIANAGEINLGVQNVRGAAKAMARWDALGKLLGSQVGEKVTIRPLKPQTTIYAMKSGQIDYMLCNPVVAVNLAEKLGAEPIASLNNKHGPQFAGVIIAKKGSGIVNDSDLKGKKVLAYQFGTGAGAFVFQVYHLMQQGIDPFKDFAVFKEAKKQDDIVLSVKAGVFDAGFIRSGVLENMVKEGKVAMNDVEIVDQKTGDGFDLVHSTELYPEFYVMGSKNADAASIAKVKASLLKMTTDNAAVKIARIEGFVEPISLDSMKVALKALKLPPYD